MITKDGYPVQTHPVITDDCYILEMHRIPYGKKSPVIPVTFLFLNNLSSLVRSSSFVKETGHQLL